jgi:glycine dehydrogenase subunit 1
MRYLPLTDRDRAQMAARIGVAGVEDLFTDVPAPARLKGPVAGLPNHQGEIEVERHLTKLSGRSLAANDAAFFLGAGAYRHHVPASVDHLIQRSEFLTSYTPYQPEIAQGTLQYLFEFQSQVALLTAMEVANASLYDGSTAAAEGVLMAARVTGKKRVVLSGNLHPQYADVILSTARTAGLTIVAGPAAPGQTDEVARLIDAETACVVVQNPDFFGALHDLSPVSKAAAAKGALTIAVVTEIVSLGAVTPPGEMGADIVAAEGQSIGNALNFGGPYVGLFAARQKYVRQMPGRLTGQTVDADGRRGFVLTLSTREQHIRRDKATSNICTNSGLCTLAFTIHLALLGEEGFRRLAALNHERAMAAAARLSRIPGVTLATPEFFNEFTLRLPKPALAVVEALAAEKIVAGLPVARLRPDAPWAENLLVVAATELTTDVDIERFATALAEELA